MSAQTSYSLKMEHGVAGGLYDLSHHVIDSRNNEAADGKVLFGLGVVDGTAKGKQVILPTADSAREDFEGVVVNSHCHEQNFYGEVKIRNNETVGVLKVGRIYVRLVPDIEPAYGDSVYLITDGEYAGYFTNSADDYTAVQVKGFFLSEKATDAIAPAFIKADKEAAESTTDSTDSADTEDGEETE